MVLAILHAVLIAAAKPNIVFVLTDDQDIELGGLTPMVCRAKYQSIIGASHFTSHFTLRGMARHRSQLSFYLGAHADAAWR